jgi:TonB family protein
MIKPLLAFFITLLLFTDVEAQKSGIVYYLTNSGKLVSTKDSSDYSMVVMPPDKAVDKSLYIVYEYDRNGKLRLVTNSYTKDLNLRYQGRYIAYFPDGKRKAMGNYQGGDPVGRQMVYFPNGKLHSIINYTGPGIPYYGECRDSTGGVLTQNGKGVWKEFDNDFTFIIAEGQIENGLQEGEWRYKKKPTESFTVNYKHGQEVQTGQGGKDSTKFVPVEVVPSFPGGIEAFYQFINKNTKYPRTARENNTSGKVIISFVVERDGSLTDVKVKRGIGDGCDEEAVRVIKLSSPWVPGTQGGKPVRVAYSVPISFGLSN